MSGFFDYRSRAYAQKRRAQQRLTEERRRNGIRIRIVSGELNYAGEFGRTAKVTPVRVILNEFSDDLIHVFSTRPFALGQSVAFTIQHPRYFYCQGEVIGWREVPSSRKIVSQVPFLYRITIAFVFANEDEKRVVTRYCEQLTSSSIYQMATIL